MGEALRGAAHYGEGPPGLTQVKALPRRPQRGKERGPEPLGQGPRTPEGLRGKRVDGVESRLTTAM